MKLVTAQELRSQKREEDDPLANIIAVINTRLKERYGLGNTTALIGFTGETVAFSLLAHSERTAIEQSLRMAGYGVMPGPSPKTIVVSWTGDQNEED